MKAVIKVFTLLEVDGFYGHIIIGCFLESTLLLIQLPMFFVIFVKNKVD